MTMPLQRLIRDPGADVFYTPEWQLMIETHLPLLLARSDNTVLSFTPAQAYKYEGDLMGLLTELNINQCYHWLLMRMNGMRTWTDFDGVSTVLTVPNFAYISRLTEVHKTTMTKIK
jgi:hypothetical protein